MSFNCYIPAVLKTSSLFGANLWLCIYESFLLLFRLAEKKATIGYTYEDSTVTEPDPQSDKDEDNSENSESEEDEGIPDIGEEMGLSVMRFTHQEN